MIVFEEFLSKLERRFKEAKERLAETGEKPQMVLFGIDRGNRRVSIVPVDPPADK